MTSRAVSPRVGKVSEEVEGGDSEVNEGASESNEEEQHALQLFDVDSETERETRQVRRQRRAHRPPTSEEIQEHLRTHLPYRSWCPHCVSGRGVSSQHHPESFLRWLGRLHSFPEVQRQDLQRRDM